MTQYFKLEKAISLICRGVAAVILLQTLFFKFTAAPESVYIFTKIGLEPWGRIGSGVVELIAAILLFVPRFHWLAQRSRSVFWRVRSLVISRCSASS